jgi:hypothetical protein
MAYSITDRLKQSSIFQNRTEIEQQQRLKAEGFPFFFISDAIAPRYRHVIFSLPFTSSR